MSRSRRRRGKTQQNSNKLPSSVVAYFVNSDGLDVDPFIDNWQALEKYDSPRAKTLSQILFNSAKTLVKKNSPRFHRAKEPVKFIRHNMHMWEDKALEVADQLNPIQIVRILWSYANFGLIPSDKFMNKLFDVAERKADNFSFSDVRMGLWALARMGFVPPESFLNICRQTIADNSRSLEANDVSLIMWSLAVLDSIEPKEKYKEMYKEMRSLAERKGQIKAIEKQTCDCSLWFRGHSDFKNRVSANQNAGTTSKLEIDLRDAFARASLKSEKPKKPLIDEFKQAIDFPVSDGKKSLWVEVDGPTHYVRKPSTGETFYNGSTIFRSALINKFAPKQRVLRIGYRRIGEILNEEPQAQRETCRNIFKVFTKKPAGVYGINEPDQTRPTDIFMVAPRSQAPLMAPKAA